MTPKSRVIRLEKNGPDGLGLAPLALEEGDFQSPLPVQHYHEYFADEDLGISVGIWDTTTMQEVFGPYSTDEFIVVLDGAFQMVDGDGRSTSGGAGESVCFRAGAPMSWKQDGYLKKFYFTWENQAALEAPLDSAARATRVLDSNITLERMETTAPFVIAGTPPEQRNHTLFTNDAENFFVGTWETGPMLSEMRPFPSYEFVRLLEGEITITEENGTEQSFGPGDCFFVPKGTVCSWSITGRVRKHYAILDI
ncbi:cupin domain-containing protein [uncultured Ruegeria sp.]|uniref:cupin domain-containing protein n=1 Tax=uncultured Ruegeria sp. TaxID=259304 RepID=UPI0026309BB2|nr:cupin domain-containing protein [uncultured Ruegeria sp.]